MDTCLICNLSCKSTFHLCQHIRWKHQITSQEYYNKYILKNNIPKCIICGALPNYQNLTKGYGKFCSRKCKESVHKELLADYYKTPEFQISLKKRQATLTKKYGGPSAFYSIKKQHKINKKYEMPSGKKIILQGYEPKFLGFVFANKILQESEIICHPKKIPYITEDGKTHHYFPDFYIPKFNLIVEIKSWWTEKRDENILLKEQACYNNNFNYIRIVDHDFKKFTDAIVYYQNVGLK